MRPADRRPASRRRAHRAAPHRAAPHRASPHRAAPYRVSPHRAPLLRASRCPSAGDRLPAHPGPRSRGPRHRPCGHPRSAYRGLARRVLAAAALAALTGCAGLGHSVQAVLGHAALLAQARPVEEVLADPATAAPLRAQLVLAQRLRAFAVAELGLPDNGSYTRYADPGRPAVLWNVFAAPELSLQLKTWCYPVIGCAAYRGYFDRTRADALAAALRADGWEVEVAPVPAYSTLGWFDDPLLGTFIAAPEGELARLLFHELAHQVVYVRDDTMFNESYATAVERAGVRRWLAAHGSAGAQAAHAAHAVRRAALLALLARGRAQLAAIYAAPLPPAARRADKRAALERLAEEYRALRDGPLGGWRGGERWFDPLPNNAQLGALATYEAWVPAFERLLADLDGDLPQFHAAVRALAQQDRATREARLRALAARAAPEADSGPPAAPADATSPAAAGK